MDCDREWHKRVANSSKIALFGFFYVMIILASLTGSVCEAMFHSRGLLYRE